MLPGMSLPQSCWLLQSCSLASALLTLASLLCNSMVHNWVVPNLSKSRVNPLTRDGENISMPLELQCEGKAGLYLGKGSAQNG